MGHIQQLVYIEIDPHVMPPSGATSSNPAERDDSRCGYQRMNRMVEFETQADPQTRTLEFHHRGHRAVLRVPANLDPALSEVLQSVAVMPGLQFQTRSRGEGGEIDSFPACQFPAARLGTIRRTGRVRGIHGPADFAAETAI
jgi:hypothetical protein